MDDRLDELKAEQRVADAHRWNPLLPWARKYADDTGWLIAEVERLRLALQQIAGSDETDLGVYAALVARIARDALARKGGDAHADRLRPIDPAGCS